MGEEGFPYALIIFPAIVLLLLVIGEGIAPLPFPGCANAAFLEPLEGNHPAALFEFNFCCTECFMSFPSHTTSSSQCNCETIRYASSGMGSPLISSPTASSSSRIVSGWKWES